MIPFRELDPRKRLLRCRSPLKQISIYRAENLLELTRPSTPYHLLKPRNRQKGDSRVKIL